MCGRPGAGRLSRQTGHGDRERSGGQLRFTDAYQQHPLWRRRLHAPCGQPAIRRSGHPVGTGPRYGRGMAGLPADIRSAAGGAIRRLRPDKCLRERLTGVTGCALPGETDEIRQGLHHYLYRLCAPYLQPPGRDYLTGTAHETGC